jgi:hypothetical protein
MNNDNGAAVRCAQPLTTAPRVANQGDVIRYYCNPAALRVGRLITSAVIGTHKGDNNSYDTQQDLIPGDVTNATSYPRERIDITASHL